MSSCASSAESHPSPAPSSGVRLALPLPRKLFMKKRNEVMSRKELNKQKE